MRLLFVFIWLPVLLGCSQELDFYNTRILGDWSLTKIDKPDAVNSIVFNGGNFSFQNDNSVIYTIGNNTYQGNWNIKRGNDFTTDDNSSARKYFVLMLDVSNGTEKLHDVFEIESLDNPDKFEATGRYGVNVVNYFFERRY